ncbi:hypothetical protein Tco_0597741 [Tanacetum coccineum]
MVKKFILKFHHLSDHNDDEEIEEEEDPNETDNAPEIFMIEGNMFDFETPLSKGIEEPWLEKGVPYQLCDHICEPYRFKNGKTKWPTCTSDIDGFCNYGELSGMVQIGSMTYFQDHRWYNQLADGKLKDEDMALRLKKFRKGKKKTWGNVTLGVIKFCRWLKSCFENFHELEYEVLVKLQECWWKVNAHEIALFTRMENFKRGPYANMKTEWVSNPYLNTNRIFGRDYEASNVGCTQENQGHKDYPNSRTKPSTASLDAYQELLRLINDGWVMTTPEDE